MPRTSRPPLHIVFTKPGGSPSSRSAAKITISGSPDSYEKYARLIPQWKNAAASPSLEPVSSGSPLPVNGVILKYLEHASGYYQKSGKPTGECENIRNAFVQLKATFGRTSAHEFGPKALELVRQAMIDAGLARTTINSRDPAATRSVWNWSASSLARPGLPSTRAMA